MNRNLGFAPLTALLLVLDGALIAVALWLSSPLRQGLPYGQAINPADTTLPTPVFLLAEVCWLAALAGWGAYNPRTILRWYQEAGRVAVGAGTGMVLMAGALYLSFREVSRLQFAYFFALSLGLILASRAGLRIYYRLIGRSRPGWRNRVLIVGAGHLGLRVARVILDHGRWGYSLAGYLDDDAKKAGEELLGGRVLATVDRIVDIVTTVRVDEVWVCLPGRSYERIQWVVDQLEKQPVRIKIAPDFFSLALVRARPDLVGGIPLIGLREPLIEGSTRAVKRVFDVLVSIGLLVILAVPMGLIALAIRLTSPGPALFRQTRIGENGVTFPMLKFRTMQQGAEDHQEEVNLRTPSGQVLHKRPGDPRVTAVGRFLRRYSLDELPQFWNVLRGDISLVGPRPELPWLVDRYDSWQRKRFAVPQGLTGWWQINGRAGRPMHLSTEDDLYYVYNYSLWLDIVILLRTPLAILSGRGAF